MSCRYCLEDEGEFVSPCRCKGSVAFIHEECLNKWIETIHPERETKCPICLTLIKTNYNFDTYLFKKRDPLTTNIFYWWVLGILGLGIILSRVDEELIHTLYIHIQVGIYIGYNSFIWRWFYNLKNKMHFLKFYLLPSQFILGFTHTYILTYMYLFSKSVDPLVINWLFCVAHLLYPISIRKINTTVDVVNNLIARSPRHWIR